VNLRAVLIKSEELLWGEEALVSTDKATTQWCILVIAMMVIMIAVITT